ncbi:MAG: BrnT family toxin [Planctomycetota bacterium]
MKLTFEWHDEKAKKNLKKHKISFEEAKTVFNDPFLMTFPDPHHSENEQRYLNMGVSSKGKILIVIHTERERNIRIISCRKATPNERKIYEKRNF